MKDELLERFVFVMTEPMATADDGPVMGQENWEEDFERRFEARQKKRQEAFEALALDCEKADRTELADLSRKMGEPHPRIMQAVPVAGPHGGVAYGVGGGPPQGHALYWQAKQFLFGSNIFRSFGLMDAVVYAWVIASILATFGE